MSDERQKPSLAFWATVTLIGLPVLYVLSVGPVAWTSRFMPKWLGNALVVVYSPLEWIYKNGPAPIHEALDWYVSFFRG